MEKGYFKEVEKVIHHELTELYNMSVSRSATEHKYGVSFAYELGA